MRGSPNTQPLSGCTRLLSNTHPRQKRICDLITACEGGERTRQFTASCTDRRSTFTAACSHDRTRQTTQHNTTQHKYIRPKSVFPAFLCSSAFAMRSAVAAAAPFLWSFSSAILWRKAFVGDLISSKVVRVPDLGGDVGAPAALAAAALIFGRSKFAARSFATQTPNQNKTISKPTTHETTARSKSPLCVATAVLSKHYLIVFPILPQEALSERQKPRHSTQAELLCNFFTTFRRHQQTLTLLLHVCWVLDRKE